MKFTGWKLLQASIWMVLLVSACQSAPIATPTLSPATQIAAPAAATPAEFPTVAPALTEAPAVEATLLPSPTPTIEPTAPALACTPPAALTPAMTEGPYFKSGSPERTSLLEEGMSGTRLFLTGQVLDTQCKPVAGAKLEFWQTDAEGVYDNSGYRLRGHQLSDAQGRYQLETVLPGLYPGRTAHIHFKVEAPHGPTLTSQLFMPDEPGNQTDRIFSPDLLLTVVGQETGAVQALFNIVLPAP